MLLLHHGAEEDLSYAERLQDGDDVHLAVVAFFALVEQEALLVPGITILELPAFEAEGKPLGERLVESFFLVFHVEFSPIIHQVHDNRSNAPITNLILL